MTLLDRVLDALDRLARWIAIAVATVIILILSAQIFFRYFLNSSIVWSEEVATWCLVWLVFIGAAPIMRRWDHVQIPMLIRRLPLGIRPGFIIFAKLTTAAAVGLVAWYGLQWVLGPIHIRSQTSGISTRWIKLAVPIGAGLMTLFALRCALEDVRRWRRGELEYFASYGDLALDDSGSAAADVRNAAPGS
jgi:TRAP-type C4-dicarboxylate transport system permease small subunit